MLLKNTSKRLITVNAPLVNGQRVKSYQIKCGLDNTSIVPDELCDNKFIQGLIASGDLTATDEAETVDVTKSDQSDDGLDDLNKEDLTNYATEMGIEVLSKWTKADIITAIRAQ